MRISVEYFVLYDKKPENKHNFSQTEHEKIASHCIVLFDKKLTK